MRSRVRNKLFVICACGLTSLALAENDFVKVFKGVVGPAINGTLVLIEKVTPITTQNAQKAVTKGVDDVAQAGEAAAKYFDQQRRLPVETGAGAFHQKNLGKSIEFVVTHPLRQTNKNAQQALRSSPVLAAAAAVAASAYGGPAGAAAFSAWATYNATGSIEAALKVGVTQGLIASATANVNAMPAGADKIAAQTTLSFTVAKAQGDSSEKARQAALGSLVSMSGDSVKAAGLSVMQRTMTMAAIGGAAVAASGGNRDAIRSGFLQGGGKVLVQELNLTKENAVKEVKDEAKGRVGAVLSKNEIAAANEAYKNAKNVLSDNKVRQLIDSAKAQYESEKAKVDAAKAVVQAEVAKRTAKLTEAREAVNAQRAAIELVRKNLDKATASIQAEAKRRLEEEHVASKVTIARIGASEKAAIADENATAQRAIAVANKEISRVSTSVRAEVVSAIADELQVTKKPAALVLDDGTMVNWNAKDLLSANNINTSVRLGVPKSAESLLDFYYAPRK
jgi:hypothetical protein